MSVDAETADESGAADSVGEEAGVATGAAVCVEVFVFAGLLAAFGCGVAAGRREASCARMTAE